jgi:HSP20 family molecular chaperone IbpA
MFELAPRRPRQYSSLAKFVEDPDSIFGRFFGDFQDVFSEYDRYTNEDGNLVYEIEVPGFNKENLNVEIADGILTIKGERTSNSDKRQRQLYKRFTVSQSEEVDASIEDGILTLVFKQPEKKKTKVELK